VEKVKDHVDIRNVGNGEFNTINNHHNTKDQSKYFIARNFLTSSIQPIVHAQGKTNL
jgi:hypothetical protein